MPYPYKNEITGDELVAEYAPIIKGKTILTTGVSPNGLGARYVETLAAGKPKLLILAGRDVAKVKQTAEAINKAHPDVQTRVVQLDLSSFAAVRKAADEVNSWDDVPTIDVLMNNAGIMAVPYKICEDGYESQLTCNHLSHFLFTNLILDKILASEDKRVVNVSSGGHWFGSIRWVDLNYDDGNTYDKWNAYGQSKTANVLFSIGLAKRYGDRGLLSYSLNPGAIMTNLANHFDFGPGGDMETLGECAFPASRCCFRWLGR
ncbi:NAD(P)-binding protein [Trichoderma chlorosporum]